MGTYLVKRLMLALPVLVGITFVVFVAVRLAPGDTAVTLAGLDSNPEILEAIRKEYGLDKSGPEQYLTFITDLVHLNLGTSSVTRRPIADEIAARIPTTATLALLATAFATVLGMTLGVLAARFQRTWLDYTLMIFAMAALSVPNYVVGLGAILIFAVTLHVLPATGGDSPQAFILPVITTGLVGVGVIARQTRSAVLDVLAEDYVRTARAKGLNERRVMYGHALRNALIPVVTIIGLIFGSLLGGTVIVETIFSLNGIGKFMIDRINSRDYPAVQGAVLVIALSYVFVNILVDVMYGVVDKRVRLK
jgi:ABC-type dipeptide/oligopeptide/nickel transport system permease component